MLEKQHGWEVIWCITLCQKSSFIEITITRLDDISALRHFFPLSAIFTKRISFFFCIFITTLHHVIYMRIHALLNQGPKKSLSFWVLFCQGQTHWPYFLRVFPCELLQRWAPLSMVLPTFLGRTSGNPWHLMSCEARAEKRWGATTYNSFEINEMLAS